MKKTSRVLALLLAVMMCFSSAVCVNASEPESIEDGNIVLENSNYTYTGGAIEPNLTVELNGAVVPQDSYDVNYSNNINVGTATVTVTAFGEYTGTLSKTFTIKPLSITSSAISKKVSKTTVNKTPTVVLSYNNKTLVKGTDYQVTFSNISKTGVKTGVAKITGLGNFNSTKSYNFNVYPNKVTSVKNAERKGTSLTLSWKTQESFDVTGYKIYTCDSKGESKSHLKTISTNSVKLTGLKEGNYYYYVVRAYKTSGDTIIYGDYSAVFKTCTTPKTVELTNTYNSTDKKYVVAKWKKVPCSGYVVRYSTDPTFKKNTKTVTLKDSSTLSYKFKADTKKTYYVTVRAFRKYGTTTVNGSWSTKLSNKYSNLYAKYTSNYVNNKDRTTNLKIASKAINGTILQPGETFSFNRVVGKRTESKGYKKAHVFTGASSMTMGVGGGVCQVASTMFNATLIANLPIVERHQHSQRVSYVPLGRDAAIYWGSEDYKFKNNTKYPIMIKMTVKDGKITCAMYTSENVKPKKTSLKVSRSGNNFTLKRYVGGKCNYTTKSTY